VGAGTGSTSATLLPLLDSERSEYVFTDVSDLFLARAREKFAAFPFVRFAVFDLEKDPETQGFPPNTFDIIVGTNVVHAARDLDGALKRINSLLAPGGFLLLVEATRHQEWFDFTTGLIEGWQHFADDLRGDNPLLAPEKWRAALLERGFVEVATFPEDGSPAEVLGQHVLLARTAPAAEGHKVSLGGVSLRFPSHDGKRSVASPNGDALSAERVQEFRQRLETALPDEREELMNDYVRARVNEVLRLDAGRELDRRHRLMDSGLDSLMAVQLRNLLESGLGLGRTLPATLAFDYPTIEAIAQFLLQQLTRHGLAATPPLPGKARSKDFAGVRAQEVEALSDDEAEAQLLKRLEQK
jgi:SAM-dependent methyltransferase